MNCGGLTQQVHASGQPDGLKLGSRPTNDSVLKMDIRGYYLAAAGFKNLYPSHLISTNLGRKYEN